MTLITTQQTFERHKLVNLIIGDPDVKTTIDRLPIDHLRINQHEFLEYVKYTDRKNIGLFLFLEEDFNTVLHLLEKTQLRVRNPFSILWWPQQKAMCQDELVKCATHGIEYVPSDEKSKELALSIIEGRLGLISEYRVLLNKKINKHGFAPLNITSGKDKYLMKQVTDYLDQHYSNEELCIHRMGKDIGMSRTNFFNKIKLITGVSPSRFVMTYRLNRAKSFLLEQQENISEVAFKVGFSSTSYFTRCFKELFKVTPTKFVDDYTGIQVHDRDHVY